MAFFCFFVLLIFIIVYAISTSEIRAKIELLKKENENERRIVFTRLNKIEEELDSLNHTPIAKSKDILPEPSITEDVIKNGEQENFIPSPTNTPTIPKSVSIPQEMPKEPSCKQEEIIEKPISYSMEYQNKQGSDFQNLFMGNIFNKIGAIAIIIAVCILIKIVSSFIVFTDQMKIGIAMFAGLSILIFGLYSNRDKKTKGFAEVLMGTGFATLLITTYCASGFMNVFNTQIATFIASLIIILMYITAEKQKTVSMIVLTLLGGYITPFLVNKTLSIDFVSFYIIFLNIISIIFTLRNGKEIINTINLIISGLIFLITPFFTQGSNTLLPILSLWGVYITYDLITIYRKKDNDDLFSLQTLINYIFLMIISISLFKDNKIAIGIFTFAAFVLYLTLAAIRSGLSGKNENTYLYSSIISLYISTFFLLNSVWSTIILPIESLIIIGLALKFKLKHTSTMAFSLIPILFAGSMIFYNSVIFNATCKPLFNIRSIAFLVFILSTYLIRLLYRKYKEDELSQVSFLYSISAFYIWIICELASFGYFTHAPSSYNLLYPIVGFIYSINLKLLSMKKNNEAYNAIGEILSVCSLVGLSVVEILMYNKGGVAFFNLRLLAYPLAMTSVYLGMKNNGFEEIKYLMILIGFMYFHLEAINLESALPNNASGWIITLFWTLYTGAISLYGISKNNKYFKNAGIWLSIILILRVMIFNLSNLDPIFRLLAFLMLGVVLLSVSYYYNKK